MRQKNLSECESLSCSKLAYRRGLCNSHSNRLYRGKDIHAPLAKINSGLYKNFEAEVNILEHMKQRCNNPKDKNFRLYGAKGIKVCDRWSSIDGSHNFVCDMGKRPSPHHSIDRIDPYGNYEPSNCRWATSTVQAINRREPENTLSGKRGVNWDRFNRRWRAHLCISGNKMYLGSYADLNDAVSARLDAEDRYFQPILTQAQ